MKTIQPKRRIFSVVLMTLAVGLASPWRVLSQGLVEFDNDGPVDAPIYDVDGVTPLTGPAFLAELYAASLGGSLQPVGSAVPFTTVYPGYFRPAVVAVPGLPPFATAVVQVVAWRTSDGASFATANHPGGHVGESSLLNIVLGGDQLPSQLPAPLTGLQSFSLHFVVPEPSVFALGLLGGAALVLGRRRGRFRGRTARQPARP